MFIFFLSLALAFASFAEVTCDKFFLKMEDHYLGEERKGVVYFRNKPGLQAAFKVNLINGELRYRPPKGDDYHFADARRENGKLSDGDYFFVTSVSDDLYAAKSELSAQFIEDNQRMRHSSFFSSSDVLGAGHFFLERGVVTKLNNRSGHYVPDGLNLFRTYLSLKEKGIPFSEDAVMTVYLEEENLFFDLRLSSLADLAKKDLSKYSASDFHWELFLRSKKDQNSPRRLKAK